MIERMYLFPVSIHWHDRALKKSETEVMELITKYMICVVTMCEHNCESMVPQFTKKEVMHHPWRLVNNE